MHLLFLPCLLVLDSTAQIILRSVTKSDLIPEPCDVFLSLPKQRTIEKSVWNLNYHLHRTLPGKHQSSSSACRMQLVVRTGCHKWLHRCRTRVGTAGAHKAGTHTGCLHTLHQSYRWCFHRSLKYNETDTKKYIRFITKSRRLYCIFINPVM